MRNERTHRQVIDTKKECFEMKFKHIYVKFLASGEKDDRIVFCNIYERTLEAIIEMYSVENNTINCAFNEHLHQIEKELEGIASKFEISLNPKRFLVFISHEGKSYREIVVGYSEKEALRSTINYLEFKGWKLPLLSGLNYKVEEVK